MQLFVVSSLLNLASLVLGLIAWGLPLVILIQNKPSSTQKKPQTWIGASFISLVACASSLCLQLVYQGYLVKISDWTALLDTVDTLVFVAATLTIVTLVLNGMVWIKNRKIPLKLRANLKR